MLRDLLETQLIIKRDSLFGEKIIPGSYRMLSTDPAAVRPTPWIGPKRRPWNTGAVWPETQCKGQEGEASVGSFQMFPLIIREGIGVDKKVTDV